jgi:hypothetical protein
MDKGGVTMALAPASSPCADGGCKKGNHFEIKKWNAVSL